MRPFLTLPVVALLAATVLLACGDDDAPTDPGPSRPDSTFFVPFPTPLEEALEQAQPGDTLEVVGDLSLSGAVTVASGITPLVIRGSLTKERARVSGSAAGGFVFDDPRPGTRVQHLDFQQLSTPVLAQGGGGLLVTDCDFGEGQTQVRVSADAAFVLEVSGCLLLDPSLFGIDAAGPAVVVARGNTISGAGDCGIRIAGGGRLTAVQNIIIDSANYGIACLSGSRLQDSGCNDIFASGTDHYGGCAEPELDFHLDPRFCPADSAAWFLQQTSPCAPANSGADCGNQLIGARDVGCFPQF